MSWLGSSSISMSLQLKNLSDEVGAEIGDDSALFGHNGLQENYTIHAIYSLPGFSFDDFEEIKGREIQDFRRG